MSITGEIKLASLATFAEDQAKRISDYTKWNIRKRFQKGIPTYFRIYGYSMRDAELVIIPKEAKIVKRIFEEYLSGQGLTAIAKSLTRDNIKTPYGLDNWSPGVVLGILQNDKYTGNLLLQKTYKPDFRSRKKRINDGVLPKYLVEDTHDAIVSKETFDAAQLEIKRRKEKYDRNFNNPHSRYSSLLSCADCGKNFCRKRRGEKYFWKCSTFDHCGKNACSGKQINEDILDEYLGQLLGARFDVSDPKSQISKIICHKDRILEIILVDGNKYFCEWKPRSRSISWTDEMREEARMRAHEQFSH